MKNHLTALLAFALLTVNMAFAQNTWLADPAHSNARFEVNHLGISFVDGEFTKLSGSLVSTSKTDFDQAKIDFSIDVNSINTRVEARDNHLRSDDFFNAEKFPTMTLKSVSFKKIKGSDYELLADLTIRDVTKRVKFNVKQHNGIITDPWGKTRVGFTATTSINRHDFNIKYNDKLPTGVEAVASTVFLTVNTELVQQ